MSATQVMDQVRPAARFESYATHDGNGDGDDAGDNDDGRSSHEQPSDVRSGDRGSSSDRKLSLLKDRDLNVSKQSSSSSSSCCNNDQQQDQIIDNLSFMEEEKVAPTSPSDGRPDLVDVASSDHQHEQQQQQQLELEEIKCSAVHSLERDMPDFDYSHLVRELRDRILKDCQLNAGMYAQREVDKCKQDTWFVERFLLRQKLDVDKAFDMLKRTMRYKNESLATSIRREDFPAEFYQVGGLFCYEDDRKGNKMLYIRLKVHRKIPEIQLVLQAFLFYNIDYLDELANGRGIAIVLDCTGAGLANADMDMLLFLISALVNYFPKGMSYLLVHELPWILKPFWHIAKAWLAEEHRELIKFSNSRTIYEYVTRENLPDFMGGTCERSYTAPPENCTTLEQACKLWGIEPAVAKRILLKFAQYLPPEIVAKCNDSIAAIDNSTNNDRDDANNNNLDDGKQRSGQALDLDQENKNQLDC